MRELTLFGRLMRHNRWDEARALAEKGMLSHPADSVWPLLCSQAHAAAGRHVPALSFARQAQTLENAVPSQSTETMAAMWYSAGLAAVLNKEYGLAFDALKNAWELEPETPDIALHLALAAQHTHRQATAAGLYRHFLNARPENQQARFNLFLCLNALEAHAEARALVDAWPLDETAPVERLLATASLLLDQKKYREGLEQLQALNERSLPAQNEEQTGMACLLRGRCLWELEREDEALAEFSRALELLPASTAAVAELWRALHAAGHSRKAEAVLREFMTKNGQDPQLEARRAFHIPAILQTAGQADDIRREIGEFLTRSAHGPLLGRPSEIMDNPPFYLAFHNRNDRALLQDICLFLRQRTTLGLGNENAALARLSAAGASPVALAERLAALPAGRRRRIGFISRNFTNHTIMSYFFRLLHALCRRLPHCFILEFPQKDNPFRQELAQRATVVTLPHTLAAAKKEVEELGLDILVYLDLGMDLLTWFLAFSRLATVQCTLYGHPMTTGISEIDFFLSPAIMEPENAQEHYSETLRTFPGLLSAVLPPPLPQPLPRNRKKKNVYLCAQSLFKVHPDTDITLQRILFQDPDAEIQFFRSRLRGETLALQERLRRTLPDHHQRVQWLEQCSELAFFGHLHNADSIVDTPHFSGGSTSFKALGTGAPVVTMEGAFMRGRQTAGLYRHMGITGLTAHTPEQLGDLALHMAHSPALKKQKQQEILAARDCLFSLEAVDHLERFLMYL